MTAVPDTNVRAKMPEAGVGPGSGSLSGTCILILVLISTLVLSCRQKASRRAAIRPASPPAWLTQSPAISAVDLPDHQMVGRLIFQAYHPERDNEDSLKRLIEEGLIGGIFWEADNRALFESFRQRLGGRNAENVIMPVPDASQTLWVYAPEHVRSSVGPLDPVGFHAIREQAWAALLADREALQLANAGAEAAAGPWIRQAGLSLDPRESASGSMQSWMRALQWQQHLEYRGVLAMARGFPAFYSDFGIHLNGEDSVGREEREEYFGALSLLVDAGLPAWLLDSADMCPPGSGGRPEFRPGRVARELVRRELGYRGLLLADFRVEFGGMASATPEAAIARALANGFDGVVLRTGARELNRYLRAQKGQGNTPGRASLALAADRFLRASAWTSCESEEVPAGAEEEWNRMAAAKSVVLLKDEQDIVPLKGTAQLRIATLAVGAEDKSVFQSSADFYTKADHLVLPGSDLGYAVPRYLEILSAYDRVIVLLYGNPGRRQALLLDELIKKGNTVLIAFNAQKALLQAQAAIVVNSSDSLFQVAAADALFGARPINGVIGLRIDSGPALHSGLERSNSLRYVRGGPLEAGLNGECIMQIDTLLQEAFERRAAPGAQVFVSRGNVIVSNAGHGYHTYRRREAVTEQDLYDLASVTKAAATTLVVMKLVEEGLIELDGRVEEYLPETASTELGRVTCRQLLRHRSGLPAGMDIREFVKPSLRSRRRRPDIFRTRPDDLYSRRIAPGRFMHEAIPDTIRERVLGSSLRESRLYRYSDLGFITLGYVAEAAGGKDLDVLFDSCFARPLGLQRLTFHPRSSGFSIVPTTDRDFRGTRLEGFTHDPLATFMGGFGGHAGLFGNAEDLAVLFRMLLNGGTYAGVRLLSEETVAEFTRIERGGRGLGFDGAPGIDRGFGHTGFTGTAVWADPESDIVVVVLTNRIHPREDNRWLYSLGTRSRVLQAVVEAAE